MHGFISGGVVSVKLDASYDNRSLEASLILFKLTSFFSAAASAFFCFFVSCVVEFGRLADLLLLFNGGITAVEAIVVLLKLMSSYFRNLRFYELLQATQITFFLILSPAVILKKGVKTGRDIYYAREVTAGTSIYLGR